MLGGNTNDSNLFVQSSYDTVNRSDYIAFVSSLFDNSTLAREALALYPPHAHEHANNKDRIGWLESDQFLCDVRPAPVPTPAPAPIRSPQPDFGWPRNCASAIAIATRTRPADSQQAAAAAGRWGLCLD